MTHVINIGNKELGEGRPTFIIAEVGSNHDGSLAKAKDMIDAAAEAGADAVKFQSFTPDGLVNPLELPDVHKLLGKIMTPAEWLPELAQRCSERGVVFTSTPFDEKVVGDLDALGAPFFKIASGDVTYLGLIEKIALAGKPIVMSVGACSLGEIHAALDVIRRAGNENIILMQCISNYPTRYEDACVGGMKTLRDEFRCLVGYSDHSMGDRVAVSAAENGAVAYERHVTFNRKSDGPDHFYAAEMDEFAQMVKKIRAASPAATEAKRPLPEMDAEILFPMRRGVYAAMDIAKGELIASGALKCVRPRKGLSPGEIGLVSGKKAARNIKKNEAIERDSFL